MTCTTAAFGVFSHKGLSRDAVARDRTFDEDKDVKHVSLLMCGTQQDYCRVPSIGRHVIKPYDRRRPTFLCRAHVHDPEGSKGGVKDDQRSPLQQICKCRTSGNDTRSSSVAHVAKMGSHRRGFPSNGTSSSRCTTSLTSYLARMDGHITCTSQGRRHSDRLLSRLVSCDMTQCPADHIRSRQSGSYRKRNKTDQEIILPTPKRRKSDDDYIDENEDEGHSWPKEQQLAPFSCHLIPALPHKDDRRQTGSMEMDNCEGSVCAQNAIEDNRPITSCQQRLVNTRDPQRPCSPTLITADIALPESIVSELEQQFSTEGGDPETQKQKFQHYKEGLERGIQEFLNQGTSIDSLSGSGSFAEVSGRKCCSFSPQRGTRQRRDACESHCNEDVDAPISSGIRDLVSLMPGRRHGNQSCGMPANDRQFGFSKALQKLRNSVGRQGLSCQDGMKVLNGLLEEGQLLLEAAQGFVLVLDKQMRILYVSSNVTQHLGYQQVTMLGKIITDYIHPKDLAEFQRNVGENQYKSGSVTNVPTWKSRRMFYVGMKFCFQKPGSRSKDVGYSLVQWNVKLKLKKKTTQASSTNGGVEVVGVQALCRPVRTNSILEIRMEGNMFISRHDMSFQFIYCDPRIVTLIGYEPSDVIGRTAYQFHSPWDVLVCKQCHKTLMLEGTSDSGYYRFLSRSGMWVWMVTQATIVYDTMRNPQYIVCKNHIISREEAQRKLGKEVKEFEDMKCLGFSMETDLPASCVTQSSSPTLAHFTKPKDIDTDKLLDNIFNTNPADVSDAYAWMPKHTDRVKNRVNVKGSFLTNCGTEMLQCQGKNTDAVKNAVVKNPAIINMADGQMSGHDLSIMANTGTPLEEVGNLPGAEMISGTVANTTGNPLTDPFDLDMDFGQGSQSVLPILTTTNTFIFNPDFGYPDFSHQDMMVDNFTDHIQQATDVSLSTSKPDAVQSVCMSNMSCVSSDTPMFSTVNTEIGDVSQSSNFMDTLISETSDTNDNNVETNGTCSSDAFSLQSCSSHQSQSGSQSEPGIGRHSNNSCASRESLMSSKLALLLQKDCPLSSAASQSMTMQSLSASTISGTQNSTMRTQCAENGNFLCGPSQRSESTSIVHNIRENRNGSSMCPNLSTASFKSMHQSPAALSCTGIGLEGQRFSSSKSCDYQHKANYLNRKTDTCEKRTVTSEPSQPKKSKSYPSDVRNISMVMTNRKCDPFLCELTNDELNLLPDLDMTDETFPDVSTTASSILSTTTVSQTAEAGSCMQTHLDSDHSSNDTTMMDTVPPSTMAETYTSGHMGDLESFLNTIPSSPGMITSMSDSSESQSIPFSEHMGFCSDACLMQSTVLPKTHDHQQVSSGSTSSNDSSDSETSCRPSLLRTLLDKGAAIQGPLTYAEFVLEKALQKKTEIKKLRHSPRHAGGKGNRSGKTPVRKSTELPLPRFSHGSSLSLGKKGVQPRTPTRELPLPSSAVAASKMMSSCFQQSTSPGQGSSEESETPGEDILRDLVSPDEDFNLPDDLLDLAVEYCASLGADQAEALLSDLQDNSSLEDNLYSLVGSPAQARTNSSTSSKGGNSHQVGHPMSSGQSLTSRPANSAGQASANERISLGSCLKESLFQSSSLSFPSLSNTSKDKSLSTLPQQDNACSKLFSKSSLPNVTTGKDQKSTTLPPVKGAKMSLLRAAVTSPDVDKLIEQIPFANTKKQQSQQGNMGRTTEDPDIVITKVTGLHKNSLLQSSTMPHGRVFKVPSPNTGKPTFSMGDNSSRMGKPTGKLSPLKAPSSTNSSLNASDHMDAVLFDHYYTASLSAAQLAPSPSSSSSSSSPTPSKSATPMRKQAGSNPLSLRISIGTNLVPKVTCISKTSQHSNTKEKSSPVSPRPGSANLSNPSSPRAAGITNSDLSSIQPVSVMIMRKEHHRSRRSKSIAIQTDNEPGEVYPEFERSPTDTILYPSVTITHPPSSLSPRCAVSPASTSASSPSSMSELERFLRGGQRSGLDDNSGGSSGDEDSRSRSSTPFLQRLLTGELSKDRYQLLDQQMLERERRESISSGSEHEHE